MNPTRLFTAITFVALAGFAWQAAHAQSLVNGQRRLVGDGQGNVAAGSGRSITTAAGGQASATTRFKRRDDGSVDASRQGSMTTANGGSAERNASVTRSADGTAASAERSTSATNARTGVSYDGSTTWKKGEGLSRSGSCTDASGTTVTCGYAR